MFSEASSTLSSLWPYPRLIVHRAGGLLAPENTLAGFAAAARLGCRAVEVDVTMTADNELVLSHDMQLGRAVDGMGAVHDKTLAQLRELDAGIRFSAHFAGERMPTLQEALDACVENNLFLNLELKPAQGSEEETSRLVLNCFERLGEGRLPEMLVSSFSGLALESFGKLSDKYARGLLLDDADPKMIEVARKMGCATIHPNADFVTREFVEGAHAAHLGVMVYTVDDIDLARRMLGMSVDAICTNRPDLMIQNGVLKP